MFDISLRPLKDKAFNPITPLIPRAVSPLHLTLLAFICGLASVYCASLSSTTSALVFWALNRGFDCLDGALARHRGSASDLGGFLDLLGDFIVYSAIPIGCALSTEALAGEAWYLWLSVAVLESTIHINNFVLFYIAAVLEKRKSMAAAKYADEDEKMKVKELTSVSMRPALVEGTESAALFTAMIAFPGKLELICWLMAGLVVAGTCQRVFWIAQVL